MTGWRRPIVTDSGGFQAYSLIHQNPKNGTLTDEGITFRVEGSGPEIQMTPELTVQLQIGFGADVVVCLDDCTHAEAADDAQRDSVRRTIAWAARCKAEFERLVNEKQLAPRPHLFPVIQGSKSRDLHRECAEALLPMGFDGFGFGGWPLDGQGHLLSDILAFTRELVPAEFPLHAPGVGHPKNVVECARMGWGVFDSAMPTRDARHGRLYTFRGQGSAATGLAIPTWLMTSTSKPANRQRLGAIAPAVHAIRWATCTICINSTTGSIFAWQLCTICAL